MEQNTVTNDNVSQEAAFAESYERTLPEIMALPDGEIQPSNVDTLSSVATALGALPEIRAIRGELVEHLPSFPITQVDKLEDYARAAEYARVLALAASEAGDDLQSLVAEGTKLRTLLLSDVQALNLRGIIPALPELKGTNGYKNLASDLHVLVAVLKTHWEAIQGRCGTQEAELERAPKLAARIIREVGLREQGPASVSAAVDIRARAFTLFVRTYDQVRRAVSYLRWNEGDVDDIVPSLYAKSTTRKKSEATEPAPATPTTPVATPNHLPPAPASATPASSAQPFLQA